MNSKTTNIPFQFSYSGSMPQLLQRLKCSLTLSTYQAGKVIFISAVDNQRLIQLPRSFVKAMGIAVKGDQLAIACMDEVILFRGSKQLASHYPKKPNVYDTMYFPRVTYHTGALDIHDIDFCHQGICAVNTNFSCIVKIDEQYNFTPIWKPSFIAKATSGDHCHLNGMAVENGEIKYVTAFAETDSPRAWTSDLKNSGILIDYDTNEILVRGLAMPHSPRSLGDYIYVLQSANGTLLRINNSTLEQEVLFQYEGFLRGLSIHQNYAFIGLSKIREDSSSFGKLGIKDTANKAGVIAIELSTGKHIASLFYENSVDEIYDVQVLPGLMRPSILNTIKEDYKKGLSLPDRTFWGKFT